MSEELLNETTATPETAETVTEAAENAAVTAEAVTETVTESMADYEKELTASLKQIHEGDILTGTVIGVTETEITLDLKYYT